MCVCHPTGPGQSWLAPVDMIGTVTPLMIIRLDGEAVRVRGLV
jgi:hypothetical protein